MKGEDFLEKSFKKALKKVSTEKKLNISDEIINYLSQILSLYYRGIPLYLIDIIEKSPFKRYKARGDVSLLLVGLFTEWIERRNRPLTERDYIITGKLNYYNAYVYLNINYGEILEKEFTTIVGFTDTSKLISQFEIFKDISENFEKYAFLLKEYKSENLETAKLFDMFNEIRMKQIKDLFEKF